MAKLGPYIREIDIRNVSGSQENLLGVSVSKEFIPSIANTIGTDWKKYKKIRKGQFCYIPDTSRRGDKIGIALLEDYDEALVSQAYTVFETDKRALIPEYLLLWFKREEFDRYARFMSHGSVREIFTWEKFCEIDLPIPSLEKQKEIVKQYYDIKTAIENKEAINNNLTEQINQIYLEKIIKPSKEKKLLIDFLEFKRGIEPGSDAYEFDKTENNIEFFRVQDIESIHSNVFIDKNAAKNKIATIDDILVSFDGSIGKIGFGFCGAYSSGMQIIKSKKGFIDNGFIFAIFNSTEIQNDLSKSVGTTIAHAGKYIKNLSIPYDESDIKLANSIINPLYLTILNNKLEIDKLKSLQILILTTISQQ